MHLYYMFVWRFMYNYLVMMTFNFEGARNISIARVSGVWSTVIEVCCICFGLELAVMGFLNIILPSFASTLATYSWDTLFLCKRNCIFFRIKLHLRPLHIIATTISPPHQNFN